MSPNCELQRCAVCRLLIDLLQCFCNVVLPRTRKIHADKKLRPTSLTPAKQFLVRSPDSTSCLHAYNYAVSSRIIRDSDIYWQLKARGLTVRGQDGLFIDY